MFQRTLGPILLGLAVVGLIGYGVYAKKQVPAPAASAEQITTVSYDCVPGQTAYDLLAKSHTVEAKDTDFGKQVLGIDGSQPAGNQYWAFYVSGSLAPVGADAYTCVGAESIEWKLDSF